MGQLQARLAGSVMEMLDSQSPLWIRLKNRWITKSGSHINTGIIFNGHCEPSILTLAFGFIVLLCQSAASQCSLTVLSELFYYCPPLSHFLCTKISWKSITLLHSMYLTVPHIIFFNINMWFYVLKTVCKCSTIGSNLQCAKIVYFS